MGDRQYGMSQCMVRGRRCRRSITAGALLVAALGFVSAPGAATEAEAPPRETNAQARGAIAVQGNRRIDADTVRSYFRAAPDGRFDDAVGDAALKALLATGLYDRVTIERAGERLVVHLTEAPVLDRVAFEGNKKIQDKELTAVIESKPRGTLQRAVVQSDVSRIMEAYRHAGRDDVGVVPQIIDRGNDRVDLIYVVTE